MQKRPENDGCARQGSNLQPLAPEAKISGVSPLLSTPPRTHYQAVMSVRSILADRYVHWRLALMAVLLCTLAVLVLTYYMGPIYHRIGAPLPLLR